MSNPAFMSVCFEGEKRELSSLYGKMKPPIELLELIRQRYPSLKYYYSAEGDEDLQFTNDVEGRYFTARYIVDAEPDMEYFDTIEEACQHFQVCIGRPVEPTWDGLCKAAEDWNDDNPDADWQINIKRFEVVTDEENAESGK